MVCGIDCLMPCPKRLAGHVEIEHLQIAGDRAADQTEGIDLGKPTPQFLFGGKAGLILLPGS